MHIFTPPSPFPENVYNIAKHNTTTDGQLNKAQWIFDL